MASPSLLTQNTPGFRRKKTVVFGLQTPQLGSSLGHFFSAQKQTKDKNIVIPKKKKGSILLKWILSQGLWLLIIRFTLYSLYMHKAKSI